MVAEAFAVGAVTRTGAVVLVALQGTAQSPRYVGRWDVSLVPPELPVQPYHAAEGLPVSGASELVDRVERAAEQAAAAALASIAAQRPQQTSDPALAAVIKAVMAPSEVHEVMHHARLDACRRGRALPGRPCLPPVGAVAG